jgi:serine/threonine protein kinase/tetratricopeptide (TPR) repeat protein
MTDLGRLTAALSDRYTIERELGAGGMATVYLARDLKHERQVAIKVLRPELAAVLGGERFLREIRVTAKLQHPHILPLFDSGQAVVPPPRSTERGTGGEVFLYYVMPYVEGESLRERLAREGELPMTDAIRILRDVVDALTEAHAYGVVHRDIKPDNVLLRGRHALVTDFGVAKAVSEATGREQLTTAGVALGTPAYMAPEQAVADPHIDHRADIYALGALAYELLAGRPPFFGTTPQMVLAAHVTEAPEPVSKHRPAVPPALALLVMKCLEKKPADRWQGTEELLPQLEALTTPSEGMTPTSSVPSPITNFPAAAPARSRTLAATAIRVARRVRGTLAGMIPNRVVVAPFDNQTGDPKLDPLGMMAADWLTQALTESGFVEVVDAPTVLVATGSLPGGEPGTHASRSRMLASETRAGTIASGAYYRQGGSLEFQSRITDARRGTLLTAVAPASGPVEAPHHALETLRERVLAALAQEFDARLGTWQGGTSQAPSYSAYLSYLEGLEAYLEWDMVGASSHFDRALSIEAAYPRALLMAGQAHLLAGGQLRSSEHLKRARTIAEDLEESRERLNRYDRAHLDFLLALMKWDYASAYQAAKEMMEAAPGSDDARREAALNALRVRRPREALALFARLDPEHGLLKRWTDEYWLNVIIAHHVIQDHKKELALARRARRQHPDHILVIASEARALAALHRVDEMYQLLDLAVDLAITAPDMTSWFLHVGRAARVPAMQVVFRWAGTELRAHGHPEAAATVFARAIAWLENRLADESTREMQEALGEFLYLAERWEHAEDVFQGLHQQDSTDITALGFLGVLAARRRDHQRAAEISHTLSLQAADPLFAWIQSQQRCWRARMAAVLGRREEAVTLLRPLFDRSVPDGQVLFAHLEMDFESLRDYSPFQELTRPKG